MFFRRRSFERPAPPAEIVLQPVGWVRNRRARPQPHGWERVRSRIEVAEEHRGRLRGIDRFSHLIVVTYLDLAAGAPEKPETLQTASGREYGIFATRSQLRPNHLGVSVCRLLGVEDGVLEVEGLDAIDGTPVLDLKPYLPRYDAVPDARIPEEL